MPWTSVDSAMPPLADADPDSSIGVLAFVTVGGYCCEAYYLESEQDWFDHDGEWLDGVTHWMLLPAPPIT